MTQYNSGGPYLLDGTAGPVTAETLANQTVTYTLTGAASTFTIQTDAGAVTTLNQTVSVDDLVDLSIVGGEVVLGTGLAGIDTISTTISAAGSLVIGGTLANLLSTGSVIFGTGGGSLIFGDAGVFGTLSYGQAIGGLTGLDILDDRALNFGALTSYTITGVGTGTQSVSIVDASGAFSFSTTGANLTDGVYNSTTDGPILFRNDGGNGTDLILCFLHGTRIAIPDGEARIETLRIGDAVTTADGRTLPVRWIGINTASAVNADPLRTLPIRVRAGALGANLPTRDLLLSPDHALFVDGILASASALVNGTSITRETRAPETFVYYHVELADHSLILAEGAPAETFVDNVDRMAFDNWAEYLEVHGDAQAISEMDYPRAKSARQVPVLIKAKLAAIAGQIADVQPIAA